MILKDLVSRDSSLQKKIMRKLLFRFYEHIFDLDLENATRSQLREGFRKFGTKEGVLVKCESFFIQAAKFSEIQLSSHILARRHNTSSNEKSKSSIKSNVTNLPTKKNPVEKKI